MFFKYPIDQSTNTLEYRIYLLECGDARDAQNDLEYISLSKAAYYYDNLSAKEADELNNLYYKEINELLIQVREDNRTTEEMLSWELYGLTLISETGLPVAKEAEKYLQLNQEELEHHHIPPVPYSIFQYGSVSNGFTYNLGLIPNPAMTTSQALIHIPEGVINAELSLIDGYNNQGVLQTHSLQSGDNTIHLNVSNYPSGLYTVVVEVDGIQVTNAHLVVIN